MKTHERLRVAISTMLLLFGMTVSSAQPQSALAEEQIVYGDTQELIIGLNQQGLAQTDFARLSADYAGSGELTSVLRSYGVSSLRKLYDDAVFLDDAAARSAGLTGTLVATVPKHVNVLQMVADVEKIAGVDYAEPNFRVSLMTNDENVIEPTPQPEMNTTASLSNASGRSMNGVNANSDEFLWVGQIRALADDRIICGATLIDRKWLLTAAQCVRGRPLSSYYIRVGARNVDDTDNIQDEMAKRVVVHPSYNATTKIHDIALIELNNSLRYSSTTRAETIGHSRADKYAYKVGARNVMVGWGMNRVAPGAMSGYLRKSNSKIVSPIDCKSKLGANLQPGKFCADPLERVSSASGLCNSDIGSGLMAYNGGRYRIIGIASTSLGCTDNNPSTYTNISQYWAWIDKVAKIDATDDPLMSAQWGLHNDLNTDIDVLDAWGVTRGVDTVIVAVVDTGVKHDHPDLNSIRMLTSIDYDFVNSDDDAMDDNGHGTHVAGIIAANSENSIGISGVCSGCALLPVKVLNGSGSGNADGVAKGIRYAADKNADVINLSLGMDPNCGCSKTIANAVNYAYNKGSFIVAAAGNNGVNKLSYPASSPRVFPVGSSTILGKRSSFSNYSEALEVVAPGSDIVSTYTDPEYKYLSGTSMASPMVAGVAGLAFSARPGLSNPQMWWLLRYSVKDVGTPGFDVQTGYGRIDAFQSVVKPIGGLVNLGDDTCNSEPSSGCGDCSTSIALGVSSSDTAMQSLYKFRDTVLTTNETGKRWTRLFYSNTLELGYLFAQDAGLRNNAKAVIVSLSPLMDALMNPTAKDVTFSAADLALITQFKSQLLKRSSPRMSESITREWNLIQPNQYVGTSVRTIWQALSR